MLNTFYDPDEHTGSVVRHGPAWAESPVTLHPALRVFGCKAFHRQGQFTRNPFHQ
jgi:hypothetical protein